MTGSIKWRGILLLFCLVISFFALAPSFSKDSLPGWWTDTFAPIHKGLDLQGGMHLVLGVDVDKAVESRIDGIVDQVEALLREKDVIFKRVERQLGDRMVVTVYDEEAGAEIDVLMAETFANLEPMTLTAEGGYIQKNFRLSDQDVEATREYAIRQSLETLRNRIDQIGVREQVLQRQTGNRKLDQLQGDEDPDRSISLLGKTNRI